MKKTSLFLIILSLFLHVKAQDTNYVRKVIDELSSEKYFGRGYLKDGCEKAADYLTKEMQNAGLEPYGKNFGQEMEFRVNSFPEDVFLEIGGTEIKAGLEYMPDPDCGDISGKYNNILISEDILKDSSRFFGLDKKKYKNKFVSIPLYNLEKRKYKRLIKKRINENFLNAKGYIILIDNYPVWGVGHKQNNFAIIEMKKDAWPEKYKKVKIEIESEFKTANVKNLIGHIPGDSDKTIVFTAHYDHLGGIGNNVFIPGAHDNASGTASCLDIARYYNENPPDFNFVVMLFAGEEAGLLGSRHYVKNPLFPLEDIDFVINLDIVGTGEEGITIVNAKAKEYQKARELFKELNDKNDFLKEVKFRGISRNSDHYPFHEKGVKAAFIYSRGGDAYYHYVKDDTDNVSLEGYFGIFKLVTNFANDYE